MPIPQEWFKRVCKTSNALECKAAVLREFFSAYLSLSSSENTLETATTMAKDVNILLG
jgi:hypothetical protein